MKFLEIGAARVLGPQGGYSGRQDVDFLSTKHSRMLRWQ